MKLIKNRIFLATICVLISAVCIFGLLGSESNEEITAYKLSESISKGTQVTEEMIETVVINSKGMENVITDKNEIIGNFSAHDLVSGQLIYQSSLNDTKEEVLEGLEKITDGKLAYSITVKNTASAVSNNIKSGDIVSVYANLNSISLQPLELKYVEVLSVSMSDENISDITLIVVEKQALLLNEYEYNGDIHLSLVHRGDDEKKQEYLSVQTDFLEAEVVNDELVQ